MNWQEQQRQANERRAQEQRVQQQRAQQEQWARQRRAEEDRVLRERLQREAWQRQEAARKQAEFDQREKERFKRQREEIDRQLRERQQEKNAARDQRKKRSSTPVPFAYHPDAGLPWVNRPGLDPADLGSYPSYPAAPYTEPHYPSPPTSRKPFFPFIDEWFDDFLGEPARARKILGLFALLGLIVGSAYSASVHLAILPYAVVGAVVGLVFPYLLKLSVKILLAACILGLAGLIVYALIEIGK
jgi:hypothetical protein